MTARSVRDLLERLPDDARPFLLDGDTSISFGECRRRVAGRAEAVAASTPPRAPVAVRTGRGLDWFVDAVATWIAGRVAVPLPFDLPAAHREEVFATSRPSLVLGEDEAPAGEAGASGHVAGLASVVYTSGSTGRPKGVALTEAALVGNALATLARLDLGPGDRLFTNIPFQFVSLISHFLVCLASGASLVAMERRMLPANFADALADSGATCFGGSPIQNLWIARGEQDLAPGFKWTMSSGDRLPVATIRLLRERYPDAGVHTFYGLTEVAGRFCALPPALVDERAGSVGLPIAGLQATVRDEQGAELPPGEQGEIHASGEYLLRGYLGRPDATAAALTPHGFRTGDVGYKDADGFLYHLGRNDDVFKCGGMKVSALLIRDALVELGCFDDVAVVPREDPALGNLPVACVVFKHGAERPRGEILRALRGTLPANHVPKALYRLDAIPRTGSGKVSKPALAAILDEGRARPV